MHMLGPGTAVVSRAMASSSGTMSTGIALSASPGVAPLAPGILRDLLPLELLDEHAAPDVTEAHQQQGKMQDPHNRAECDAGKLEATDVVERGLTFPSKNIQHVANEDPRLRVDCGLPEPKQRAVACEEQGWKKAEQHKHGGACVDDQGGSGDRGAMTRVPRRS
ncbi:hypothetical protein CLAIMM_12667 [Cladophialophora immunda]|nr:hypothetical protein CLAIMM_12667 [Cladophialophora immunda]